jgi:hypothetical protein
MSYGLDTHPLGRTKGQSSQQLQHLAAGCYADSGAVRLHRSHDWRHLSRDGVSQ